MVAYTMGDRETVERRLHQIEALGIEALFVAMRMASLDVYPAESIGDSGI